jgi:ribosome biogenesis GTPase A
VNARDRNSIVALRTKTLAAAASCGATLRCNVLVAGFPNCGKSTIINAFRALSPHTRKHTPAITGAKPGVTRLIASFKVAEKPPTYMLDSPGLMVPSNLEPEFGLKLAILGVRSGCLLRLIESTPVDCLPTKIVPNHVLLQYMLYLLNEREQSHRYVQRYGLSHPTDDASVLTRAMAASAHRVGTVDDVNEWAALKFASDMRSGALGPLMLESFDDDALPLLTTEKQQDIVERV